MRRRTRLGTAAITVVTGLGLLAPLLLATSPAGALDAERVGPIDRQQRGFPAYYTDDRGRSLQMCDDGSPRCLLARPADLAPPDGEQLYWAAFGELSGRGIDLSVEMAVEAAWLGREQVVFDRLRVRGHVARAGRYTLVHPYGRTTLVAGSPSEQRNVNFTEDLGCEPAARRRCDFRAAARGHITTWLRQVGARGRYLGDPEDPARVTGGVRQFARVTGPAGTATTRRFGVLGKRANPNAVSIRRRLRLGNVRGPRQSVLRVQNIGTGRMTIERVRLRGAATFHRMRTRGACRRGDVLRVGQVCRVGIRYRPDGRRRSSARLTVVDDVQQRRVRIRARTAAVFSARHRVRFLPRRSGTAGVTRRIVVTNRGPVPMRIRSVRIEGRHAPSFERRSGSPRVCRDGVRVPAGGRCAVYVRFAPPTFGPKRARVEVSSNALREHVIKLRGDAR